MHQQNTTITWKTLGSGPHPECPGGVPQGQISSFASSVSSKWHCPFNEKERKGPEKEERGQGHPDFRSLSRQGEHHWSSAVHTSHKESTDGVGEVCHGPGTHAHCHWSLPKSLLKTVLVVSSLEG